MYKIRNTIHIIISPILTRSMSTTPPTRRRAAIAQLCSTSNKITNIINIAKCAGMAKRENACMLLLPECFGFIGESSKDTLENAEPPLIIDSDSNSNIDSSNDYTLQHQKIYSILSSIVMKHWSGTASIEEEEEEDIIMRNELIETDHDISNEEGGICNWGIVLHSLRSIAHISNMWISGGGMHESNAPPNGTRVYNSHVIINSDGKLVSVYRKIHLFDVSIPDKNIHLKESTTTAPGNKLVIVPNTPLGNLGLSTCYDIRFPEMYTQLVSSEQGNADVILIPSAFTVPTGEAHWHTLCKARAIETQCYVLASAQVGEHNLKRESYGHSIAIDPWGVIVAEDAGCDGNDELLIVPSIIICDVDLEKVQSIRQRMPLQTHRDSVHFSF